MSSVEGKPSKKKFETWKIVLVIMVVLTPILFLVGELGSKPTPKPSKQMVTYSDKHLDIFKDRPELASPTWYPKGFDTYSEDSNVAWRWLENNEFKCTVGDSCWGMLVIAQNGCPNSLYGEVSILDSSGTQISYTNDSLSVAMPMQKNKLIFDSFEPNANKARLARISCR